MLSRVLRLIARALLRRQWATLLRAAERELYALDSQSSYLPSLHAQCLLISAEDHRHVKHPGYDWIAICRAIWRRLSGTAKEGASTIEQQIVRVLTGRFEPTLRRKISEVLLASLFAQHIPKRQHPALYLWLGYYGWRMNGYLQACRRLGFDPRSLSLEEAAEIVARLKYPEPQIASARRARQIAVRVGHLRKLYVRHRRIGAFDHVLASGCPLRSREATPLTLGAVSTAGGA